MKKIICLLSILSLLLCACSPNNNDSSVSNTDSTSNVISSSNNIDSTSNSISSTSSSITESVVSQDSKLSSIDSIIENLPDETVYLPLDYMYAINLDNGGKVKPGMTREEVEKIFPQPENEDVEYREIWEDEEKIYGYRGLEFVYSYDDFLFRVFAYNNEYKKTNTFNYEIGGLQSSDLCNTSYEDIIKIFGKPTLLERLNHTSYIQPTYFCRIEDDRLSVLTTEEYETIYRNEDIDKIFNIDFRVNDDLKIESVELDNHFYALTLIYSNYKDINF